MKLKFYLRGMGVGVIVTSLIFMIAMAFYEPTITDEEVELRAKRLGMVYEEESDSSNSIDQDNTKKQSVQNIINDGNEGAETTTEEIVSVTIDRGTSSYKLSQTLQDLGLVDDALTFDKYLDANNYDSFLQPGDFEIPVGSTYEDIAKIITSK